MGDFTTTKGGLYGLDKPLQKWDWLENQGEFGKLSESEALAKTDHYREKMEKSYCFNNPAEMIPGGKDENRPCPDPSSASMAVSKKLALSMHNSTFKKFAFCLSWSAVNTGNPAVMQNPLHKDLTVPFSYNPV